MRTVLDIRTAISHFPGIGRYSYQLACALSKQRHRGELVLLANGRASETRFDLSMLEAQPGTRIVRVEAPPFTPQEQIRIPGILRGLAPALAHFPYQVMPYAASRPLVLTVHDIIPVRLPQFFTLRQRILYRASLALALRRADCVICVSESTRSDLQARFHLHPSRLFVVHEGVGAEFHPSSSDQPTARKAFNLPDEYVLYVGSNKPHKNLPILVEALAQLRSKSMLVCAGPSDNRFDRERKSAVRLELEDRVRFLGAVPEEMLPALYGGAKAFVFPSLYEGFGLPVLEAMASGVPVACSDIPSLRETAADAALFFDPADHRSVAWALERIVSDEALRARLHDRGIQRAAELSWDAAAQKTLAVYESAVSRQSPVASSQ